MQERLSASEWERWLLPLAVVALVVLLGAYGATAVLPLLAAGTIVDTRTLLFAIYFVPAAGTTLLLLLVGLATQIARPRRTALFLTFVTLELASLGLVGLYLALLAARLFSGPVAEVQVLGYISVASGALSALGLFVLVLLARPTRARFPPPFPGYPAGPLGPIPPPP